MKQCWISVCALVLLCTGISSQQQPESNLRPLYVKATIYPTFSRARYDIDNDLDKVELRFYMELRSDRQVGEIRPDATVEVNGYRIGFNADENDYRRRIHIKNSRWERDLTIRITTPEGWRATLKYRIPGWLLLQSPMPALVEAGSDIPVSWTFSEFSFPVNIHATDFKAGDRILRQENVPVKQLTIPGRDVPADTIIRVWITPAWFFKRYIRAEGVVRGSEINIIPWSQTFIKTGSPSAETGKDSLP